LQQSLDAELLVEMLVRDCGFGKLCGYNERMTQTATPLESVKELIRVQNYDRLRQELSEIHFSDVADMIIELPPEEEAVIFRILPKDQASVVFSYLPLDAQEELIRSLASNVARLRAMVLELMSIVALHRKGLM